MELFFTCCIADILCMGSFPAGLALIAKQGFKAVEGWPFDAKGPLDAQEFNCLLESNNLQYIAHIFPKSTEEIFQHIDFVAHYKPVRIVSSGGLDYLSEDEALQFCRQTQSYAHENYGIELVFETARSSPLATPWACARMAWRHPSLRLCIDLAQFCIATQSDLRAKHYQVVKPCDFEQPVSMDREAFLQSIFHCSDHINAVVATSERAQVDDPRTGDGLGWTEHFETMWDQIHANARERGCERFYVNMRSMSQSYARPHSHSATDQHELNQWMLERLQARWQ